MYRKRAMPPQYSRSNDSNQRYRNICIQYLILLLFFALQQVILYYPVYYIRNERRILYVLILDAFIVLYLLLGTVSARGHSATCVAIQWRLCCTSTLIKLCILLFVSHEGASSAFEASNRFAAENYLAFIGFYLTPIMYILFNRMSNLFLFNRQKGNVNVDELLHSDLALATFVDMWDVVSMLDHLLREFPASVRTIASGRYRSVYAYAKSSSVVSPESRNYTAYAVLCVCSIFLLGFVAPTVDSDLDVGSGDLERRRLFWSKLVDRLCCCRRRNNEKRVDDGDPDSVEAQGSVKPHVMKMSPALKGQYLDMFTIAKFTFLIGFCLIDVPFFIYRLLHLLQENVLSIMIYKNLLGMVMRPYRLALSQLAERDSAKGWQSAFFEAAPLPNDPATKRLIHDDLKLLEESSDSENERQFSRKFTDRMMKRGKTSLMSNLRSHTRSMLNRIGSFMLRKNSSARQLKPMKTTLPPKPEPSQESLDESSPRGEHAPTMLRFKSQVESESNYDDWSSTFEAETTSVSDAVLSEKNVENERRDLLVRMLNHQRTLPVTTLGFSMIYRKCCDALWRLFKAEPSFDMESSELLLFERSFEFARMLAAIAVALLSRAIIVICCYNSYFSVRSPRFLFGREVTTASRYEMVLYGVVVFAPLIQSALFYRLQRCGWFGCLCLWVQEAVNLCSYVTCVCCLRGFVKTPNSVVYAMEIYALLQWPLCVLMTLLVEVLRNKLNTVRLIYVLCKHGMCPVSLNHTLFCNDLLKNTTVCDLLLESQWNYFSSSILFRSLCCSFSPTKTEVVIILVDLLLRLMYIICCQAMRVMMFRKYEIQYVMLRMANSISFDYQAPGETFALSSEYRSRFITPANLDAYICEHGLLSSPGIIYPPFF
ncbi:hypothetical protein, conserved [Babesia bigemina]|uniref:Transmembrane protein n=1 Tax=Babesia bigemina TaxID=5866 RepID=A0A061D991_BABBI|nr:hypothetical protein, conserved [Babesia bigemina]CDR95479.1 hypothetical protein, conserved [Babesia bigemina]|eukprot:XP_012767665.1 hypothetical protein, conserved [Babesia bigemina]